MIKEFKDTEYYIRKYFAMLSKPTGNILNITQFL